MTLRRVLVRVDRDSGFGAFVVFEAGEGLIGEAGGVAGLGFCEATAFALEDEVGVVDQGHAVGLREGFGSGSDEVDVRAFFENDAGGVDGIADALDASDSAGFHAASIHEERVELDAAVGGEEAAAACVEGGVVFEDGDGGFNRIDGCTAAGKDFMAGFERAAHAGFVCGRVGVGNGPGASMDEERGVVGCGGSHGNNGSKRQFTVRRKWSKVSGQ